MTISEIGKAAKDSGEYQGIPDEIAGYLALEDYPKLWDYVYPGAYRLRKLSQPGIFRRIFTSAISQAEMINKMRLLDLATQQGLDVPTMLQIRLTNEQNIGYQIALAEAEARHMLYVARIEKEIEVLRAGQNQQKQFSENIREKPGKILDRQDQKPESSEPAFTFEAELKTGDSGTPGIPERRNPGNSKRRRKKTTRRNSRSSGSREVEATGTTN